MSSFLGPIHFWLYEKIRFQEGLTAFIFDRCCDSASFKADEDKNLSLLVKRNLAPLDSLVDTMNIHGWLQERIEDAEKRYATLVTTICGTDSSKISEVKKAAFDFGVEHGVKCDSARDVYKAFDDSLLNGMPCDRVCVVLKSEEDDFEWELSEDIHGKFWNKGFSDLYYELRLEVMKGMLENSAFKVMNGDCLCYKILRK
ncbi:hypothetical protein [Treponema pectinovorum]|uniref:hypothetical protein n=1 Tax=Treponema pectinovorum TaxID=164 RepID=UPI0011F141ED|nr:hypothetical protein [Treponema pectinovorum]